MQKFLIKDGVGFERDFGNPYRSAKFAIAHVGKRAVVATTSKNLECLWMLPEDAEYWRGVVGDFTIVNTAQSLIDIENNKLPFKPAGAERVRHCKFGEGSVIHRAENRVLVQFDSQKKALALIPAALESI